MARINILFDPGLWFSVGCRRRPDGWISYLIPPFAVAIAVYVILAATYIIIDPWVLTAVFLAGMMTLAFLTVGATANADTKRVPWYDLVLSLLSLASGVVERKQQVNSLHLAVGDDDEIIFCDRRGRADPARHGDREIRAGLRRMVEPDPGGGRGLLHGHAVLRLDLGRTHRGGGNDRHQPRLGREPTSAGAGRPIGAQATAAWARLKS